ncbi:hypothetical protein NFX46_05865 [Streptomyces phaeoluteigriseus]|uniref:Integral membrane protein n=1 Tax=Streptomyces phaeoluteigriseus TaxID=114686 RepID=A0ABY4Z312_9ACTN|nr:hypothetical protein [Streptomyces phaeoluteigriseus]USQ83356.1 hypothetical protein NFX46_05865 [Streptomyces phaeoluteigriseus]
MSGLGELDRPATPASPGAWDERSGEWLVSKDTAPSTDARHDSGGPAVDTPAESPAPTSGTRPCPGSGRVAPRRGGAVDPVKALMHRHRELCERAVDPLEIAAGLEAHGVTDRTAARFRHRDVFSLAEEMYARVPRDGDTPPRPESAPAPRARLDWALLTLLPGALTTATVVGLRLTHGQARFLAVTAGVLAVALALRAALRRGPLSRRRGRPSSSPRGGPHPGRHRTGGWTCWLLAYAALGDGLLRAAADGGPDGLPTGTADGPWPLAAAPLLTLALACAPAAWCAHLLAVSARRRLGTSRGLDEFVASVRPLLLGILALFLCVLVLLTGACAAALGEPAAYAGTLTLGSLLLLSRLLTVHGFTHVPAVVLRAAGAAEAIALATLLAGRLPRCGFLTAPVDTLLAAWGPAGVPALACGAAALTLLIHATRILTRASAHARTDQPC